jgi:Ca2+-binding RTX toxin-like protein
MRRRRRTPQKLFAAALFVAVGFGYVTSQAFTASNTVPSTNIGQLSQAISVSQLEPAECLSGGITATSIVAGAGSVTATAANQLVLGSSGNDTLTDSSGGSDCLVGGAATDTLTGWKNHGDLCIPSTLSTTKNCTIVATRP